VPQGTRAGENSKQKKSEHRHGNDRETQRKDSGKHQKDSGKGGKTLEEIGINPNQPLEIARHAFHRTRQNRQNKKQAIPFKSSDWKPNGKQLETYWKTTGKRLKTNESR